MTKKTISRPKRFSLTDHTCQFSMAHSLKRPGETVHPQPESPPVYVKAFGICKLVADRQQRLLRKRDIRNDARRKQRVSFPPRGMPCAYRWCDAINSYFATRVLRKDQTHNLCNPHSPNRGGNRGHCDSDFSPAVAHRTRRNIYFFQAARHVVSDTPRLT